MGGEFGGGADTDKFPRFIIGFPTAIPFSASYPSLPPSRPPAPSVVATPAFSRRSASSDRSENCRGAGPRDGVGGDLCRRRKELTFFFSFLLFLAKGVIKHHPSLRSTCVSSFLSSVVLGVEPPSLTLVGPPVVAVVRRLVHLRLLLNGSVLAPLSGAALPRERLDQST